MRRRREESDCGLAKFNALKKAVREKEFEEISENEFYEYLQRSREVVQIFSQYGILHWILREGQVESIRGFQAASFITKKYLIEKIRCQVILLLSQENKKITAPDRLIRKIVENMDGDSLRRVAASIFSGTALGKSALFYYDHLPPKELFENEVATYLKSVSAREENKISTKLQLKAEKFFSREMQRLCQEDEQYPFVNNLSYAAILATYLVFFFAIDSKVQNYIQSSFLAYISLILIPVFIKGLGRKDRVAPDK